MLSYTMFLILFTISSLIMYFIDGIVAFFIPGSRVEKKLTSEKTAQKITKLYGKKMWAVLKPELEESADRLLMKFTNSIESRVNTHITNVINNDVKHMMEEQIRGIKLDFPDKKEILALTTAFRSFTSSSGILGKAQIAIEDQAREMALYKNDPEKFKQLQYLKFFGKKAGMSKSEIRDLIQIQAMAKGGSDGQGQESIPVWPQGPTGNLPAAPQAQEVGTRKETQVGPVGPKTQQKAARNV